LKELCQTELAKVEPILEAALKNLDTVSRDHLDFIKSMKNPPIAIERLYKALVIFWEIKNVPMVKDPNDQFKKIPDYATPAKKQIINKPDDLLKQLKSFDEEKITSLDPKTVGGIRDMFDNDPDFTIDKLAKSAEAAKQIGLFLLAVVEVYDKSLIINPKREEVDTPKRLEDSADEIEPLNLDKEVCEKYDEVKETVKVETKVETKVEAKVETEVETKVERKMSRELSPYKARDVQVYKAP